MKVSKAPHVLTADPVSVSDLVTPFETLELYKNAGLISAENFDDLLEFDSSFIKDVVDCPNYNKQFIGQFFDNDPSGEAVDLHSNYNDVVAEIDTDDIIISVEYQMTVDKDGYDLKTSSDLGQSIIGATILSPVTGGLSFLGLATRGMGKLDVTDDLASVSTTIAKGLNEAGRFIKGLFGGGGKKKSNLEKKIDYATRETLLVPVPFGYRYLKHSTTGGIYADLSSKFGQVVFDTVYSGDDVVVFAPQILFSVKLAEGETYVHQGHVQIVLEAKL